MKLNDVRNKIDIVDQKIAKLLNERFILIKQVKKIKSENIYHIEDIKRENEIINNNLKYINESFKEYYKNIYDTVFKVSKDIQKL